jgi:hypothetical protein
MAAVRVRGGHRVQTGSYVSRTQDSLPHGGSTCRRAGTMVGRDARVKHGA